MALDGQVALVTGSSHGIGAAAALAFARAGCRVGLNYHLNPEGAESVASAIREAGGEAEVFGADVGDAGACEGMVRGCIERFGRLDVLVNNAGGALAIPPGGFADMPLDYWRSQIDLNLNAAAYASRVAVRHLLERRAPGAIINVSSIHGDITWVKRKLLPYSAAKAGLNMFTKALAVEVAKHGIRVNGIAPGFILTKISDRYSDADMAAFLRKIPLGRLGKVEDVTPLMLFLADGGQSGFVTGQTFTVDGGQSVDGGIDSMLENY